MVTDPGVYQVAARTDRTTEALADLEHEFRALRKVLNFICEH